MRFSAGFIVVLLILIVTFSSLEHYGYWEKIVAFLDSDAMTLSLGKQEVSAYLALKSLFAVIVIFLVARTISILIAKPIRRLRRIKPSNRQLLQKFSQIFIYLVAFMTGLKVLGIDLTALAIFGSAVGIGLGFGLQKITSNFISGLILLFEKSVRVGDLVEIGNNLQGFIRYTAARYTLLETIDGQEILVPNEDFITNSVVNWTHNHFRGRLVVDVGVSYDSDMKLVHEILIEAVSSLEECLKDPAPECYLKEFGDSSVNFSVKFWIDDYSKKRFRVHSKAMHAVWDILAKHQVTIPFPQRDLHIKENGTIV